jgi:hypothetical protein
MRLAELIGLLDEFPRMFEIVEPRGRRGANPSFRGDAKASNYDVQLHIGESRDSGSGPEPVIGRRLRRPVGTIPE